VASEERIQEAGASALAPGGKARGWRLSGSGGRATVTTPAGGHLRFSEKLNATTFLVSPGGWLLLVFRHTEDERFLAHAHALAPDGSRRARWHGEEWEPR